VTLTTSRELFATAKLSLDLGYDDLGASLLEHLLEQLPGYVAARCLLGDTFVAKQRWDEAEEQFQYPLAVDPLNQRALAGLARVELAKGGSPQESEHAWKLRALHPYAAESTGLLEKALDESSPLILARILTWSGRAQDAVPFYEAACDHATGDPQWRAVLELLLAQALWVIERVDRARPLVERLVEQQAMWIRPKLILADIALQNRDDALGVALAHDATALDPSLTAAQELLGGDDRYAWLIVRSFELAAPSGEALDGAPHVLRYLLIGEPLPAPLIAQEGGEGQLVAVPRPDRHHQKGMVAGPTDDSVSQSQSMQLLPVAETLDDHAAVGGPEEQTQVRLILTSRDRIVARYGKDGYEELDSRLSVLCEAVARSTGDEGIKLSVDDDSCLAEFGLSGVDPSDPCQIARLIGELDATLKGRSIRLVSLLIVGGDAIIPFHRLPNPADDEDPEVLSDWPYAAEEETFLLSRFSVGRLPDCEPADLGALLGLVDRAIDHHNAASSRDDGVSSSSWLNPVRRLFGAQRREWTSVGYTAEIWAEASRAVFEVIGDASRLQVSPPSTDYDFLTTYEELPTLGYFNLHGFRGSPYWYGHGDSEYGSPLLPIALTPLSVSWADVEGAVVYSEACYGADLERAYPEGSIPVNFLAGGALGFIGCTGMSYGTLTPPLSGADLLGKHVWEGVSGGLSIGDALRRARAAFIRTLADEQGYLDGEDQKALMGFVLYGDPSLSLRGALKFPDLEAELDVACPPLACCSRMMDAEALPLSKEARQKVKRSLPFLDAGGFLAHPLILCRVGCSGEKCGTQSCGCEQDSTDRVSELVQASQQHIVSKGEDRLRQVVKVTVNADGDVVKVLVSRGGTRKHEGSK